LISFPREFLSRSPLTNSASPIRPSLANHRIDWLGAGLVLFSSVAFSAKAIFVKLAYHYPVDALTLLTLRMIFSLPMFLVLGWWAGTRPSAQPLARREWIAVVFLGAIGYYAASLLDFMGLQYVSAGLERLVLFLYPTFVVLMSVIFFGYRVVRRDLFALCICYAGIVLVFINDLTLHQSGVVIGTALILLSALCYAGYLVGSGQMVNRIGSMRFGTYASIVSTLAIFLHFLLFRDVRGLDQPAGVLWAAGAMAIFSTVLPVVLMAEGVRRIGSSSASMLGAVGPIATIFMGYVFLGEAVTLVQICGAILVLIGVLAISLKKRPVGGPAAAAD
jgi:drug/metabolite transporter (DMT)-like permease